MDEPTPPAKPSLAPAWLNSRGARTAADVIAFAMLALAATGLAVFAGRREIARQFAEDWLAERGIESGFTITRVDAGGFIGKVRLGPAADPIFAADRVEVAYDFAAPWTGAPFSLSTTAVRIVRPRLKLAFDGERLSAGPLDPLITEFLARPDSGKPGPAVLVEDAHAVIVTPNGPLRLVGAAAIDDGALLRFDGALLPSRLTGQDFIAASDGGRVRLRKAGDSLSTSLRLDLDYTTADLELEGADVAVEGIVPYPDFKAGRLAGAVALRTALRAERLTTGAASLRGAEANFRLSGAASGKPASPAFSGDLGGTARAATLAAGATLVRDARGTLDLRRLMLTRRSAQGAGGFTVRSGPLGDGMLTAAQAKGEVSFEARPEGLTLIADADARAHGAMPADRARKIAAGVPVVSADPVQAAAIAAALRNFDIHAPRLRLAVSGGAPALALGAPATLTSASGGKATISPRGGPLLQDGRGGFDLALSGGGLPNVEAEVASFLLAGGGVDARLALRADLDAPPARDAAIEVDGRLLTGGGLTSFILARCGQVSAAEVDFGDNDVTGLTGRLCPGNDPLVRAGGGAWRMAGRFEALSGRVPSLTLAADGAAGAFTAGGRGGLDEAQVRLDGARLADPQPEKRFNPIRASGRASLAGEVWRAALPLATSDGRPVAEVSLVHDMTTGAGRADIAAKDLSFHSPGLQPVDLSPLGQSLRNAEGTVSFQGRFAWTPDGATSGGTFQTPRLTFASPAGTVTNLSTRIEFTSLSPLLSAPGQTLAVERVNAIVPLDDVAGRFALEEGGLRIDALSATAAKGRVSLEPTVAPLEAGKPFRGVMVLDDVDLGGLVAGSTLADKIQIEAVVDGRLPFEAGPAGLRFSHGKVVATGPGRIAIDRTALSNVETGAADPNPMDAAAPKAVNAIQDFAYQAMENLAFEDLEAGVDSTAGGRLSVLFRIKGHHDPEVAEQARVGLSELLSGEAFRRRIPLPKGTPVDLTLDTSLNFDELLADWRRQWSRTSE